MSIWTAFSESLYSSPAPGLNEKDDWDFSIKDTSQTFIAWLQGETLEKKLKAASDAEAKLKEQEAALEKQKKQQQKILIGIFLAIIVVVIFRKLK